jgi:hypothetical protein
MHANAGVLREVLTVDVHQASAHPRRLVFVLLEIEVAVEGQPGVGGRVVDFGEIVAGLAPIELHDHHGACFDGIDLEAGRGIPRLEIDPDNAG